jgi:hypothetical protein
MQAMYGAPSIMGSDTQFCYAIFKSYWASSSTSLLHSTSSSISGKTQQMFEQEMGMVTKIVNIIISHALSN